jgi:hypothetical protein
MGHRSEFYSRPMNLRGTHSIGRAALRRIGTTFRAFGTLCAAVGAAAALAGCEDTGEADGDQPSGNISLRDENNYTSSSDLMLDTLETSASDLEICWTGLTSDLQCHDVNPKNDIKNVSLLRFRGTTKEAVSDLLVVELPTSKIEQVLQFETSPESESTCTKLSSFGFLNYEFNLAEDYVADEQYTYLLVFAEDLGVGAKSMQFVKPTTTSMNTRVDAPGGCGLLDFKAYLRDKPPVSVPAEPPWVIDWSQLTRDGQNSDIDFSRLDSALLGFYPDMTVEQVEAEIFDIEQLASPLWDISLTPGRKSVDLADARERDGGAAFTGFDRDREGVWLFALLCSSCQNPQPIVLAALQPAL